MRRSILLPRRADVIVRAALAVAVLLAAAPGAGCGDDTHDTMCADAIPAGRTRRVALSARAFDVVVGSDGYVVATSRGVMIVDPCSFAVTALCEDTRGVRHVALRGDLVEYVRHDGTAGACDRSGGGSRPAPAGAAERVVRSENAVSGAAEADLGASGVELRPGGARPVPLRGTAEALALAFAPDGHELAVSDRSGTVRLYSVPGGLQRDRWQALDSNAYAVAYDAARDRILAAGDVGALAIRRGR